jgi:hypothetical protein
MNRVGLTYRANAGGAGVVNLDRLVGSRLLAQANSGGGKSRLIRQMLEETHGRIQQFVIDPEGEFFTLREKFDYVLAAKTGGDVEASPKTAKLLCRRLVELGASAVLDLYDLSLTERREFVKLFLTELMALPRSLWRPILIVIDEAHVFAPERGAGESQSTEAVITLCTQGRKRGFCAVLATQRISKLHKDAAAELLNKLIGRTGLDVDVKRAGDELGFDKESRQTLPRLEPGEFYAYGPAIGAAVQLVKTGDVQTTHPEAGKVGQAPPPPRAKVKALLSQLADLPQQAAEEARTVADLEKVVKQLRTDLRVAQRGAAERIVEKPVVDQRAIDRAVAAAVKPYQSAIAAGQRKMLALVGTVKKLPDDIEALIGALNVTTTADSRADVQVGHHEQGTGANHPAVKTGGLPSRSTPRPPVTPSEGVSTPQQRMLDALASFEAIGVDQMAKAHVAVYSDQSSRSSGFRANLSTLSAKGLIERVDSESIRLTDDGRALASGTAAPATLEELHDAWKEKLSGPQRLMLALLIDARHDGIDRDDLAKQSGQSPLSSGYRANLSTLSALGLVRRESGNIFVSDLLYPEGLD